MAKISDTLSDDIIRSCIDLYKKLPKTGKPIETEWTVLSCIVQYDNMCNSHKVVSLGTGSKCIGASKMSASGNILNDSHAEVIARRGFLVYLYENIENALKNNQSIFTFENGRFVLKSAIEFIFYSSQMPCGDASIMPRTNDDDYGDIVAGNKRGAHEDMCDVENKREKLESPDIHRTGAKCLPEADQDPKGLGAEYHVIGQVRTKPGRGDRTLSVSCSDKIARWIHIGIQGGLMDMLLDKPVYIKHFVIGANVPYSEESLNRALINRNGYSTLNATTTFQQCSVEFPKSKTEVNVRPAPVSIICVNTEKRIIEYASQGKKMGLTKKTADSVTSYLSIHKYNLYKRFQQILKSNEEIKQSICGDSSIQNIPYNKMKHKSERYQKSWKIVRENFFKTWTVKPDMWSFCVNM